MRKIQSVKIIRVPDYETDLSRIGTFGAEAKDEFAINHHEKQGFSDSRTFEWFNPQPGTCETKEHAEQTYARMMEFERGDLRMEHVAAIATIQTSGGGRSWLMNKIASGGLYGIESDIEDGDAAEIVNGQLEELTDALIELGFKPDEIKAAPIEK